jgi:hypothetical protein
LVKLAVNVTDWPITSVDEAGESVTCAADAVPTSRSAARLASAAATRKRRLRRDICGIVTAATPTLPPIHSFDTFVERIAVNFGHCLSRYALP